MAGKKGFTSTVKIYVVIRARRKYRQRGYARFSLLTMGQIVGTIWLTWLGSGRELCWFFRESFLHVLLDSNLIFTIKTILQTSKSQAAKVVARLHISDGLPHLVYSLLPLVKHKSSLYPAAHINTFYFVLHSHKNENINKNFQRHVLAIRRREVVSGCDNFCRCWWGSNRRLVGRSKRRAVEVAKEFPLRIFLGCKFTWNIIGWSERRSGTAALEKRSAKFFYSS